MKKLLFIAAVLFATTIALTACGDDEPSEQTTATATYSLTLSQDLLDACNVFITYKAENGRNVHEAVLTPRWTKTVTSTRFPAEFGVEYTFSTKSDGELVKDKYDLECIFQFSVNTSKGASYTNSTVILSDDDVAKNRVVEFLKRYSGKSTGYKVTENGNVSPANNMDYSY